MSNIEQGIMNFEVEKKKEFYPAKARRRKGKTRKARKKSKVKRQKAKSKRTEKNT